MFRGKMEDNIMMIKWLIFHFESGVCLLAKLGTFSISQCFFCLGRSKPPTHPSLQGSPQRKLGCVSPQPCQHALCLLDAKRKKLREGSRVKLWNTYLTLHLDPGSSPPWWHVSPPCHCFSGAQGKNSPSVSCFFSHISTERRKCPALAQGKKPD